jgi:methylglyoxal synthase
MVLLSDNDAGSNDGDKHVVRRMSRRDSVRQLLGINASMIQEAMDGLNLRDEIDSDGEGGDVHTFALPKPNMARGLSFRSNVLNKERAGPTMGLKETAKNLQKLNDQISIFHSDIGSPFETKFEPGEMRQLALVAHNHMKPAMKFFIETHAEILKKFRITGTNTTMSMCKSIFGDDESVVYGQSCTSGPLGGDAQLAALMCLEDVGGIIFFMDPLSAHPHQADIDSLVRLSNVNNVVLCPNPTTAIATMWMFRQALISHKAAMVSIIS